MSRCRSLTRTGLLADGCTKGQYRPYAPRWQNCVASWRIAMKHLTLSALFKCAPWAIIVAWISLASGLVAPPEARSEPGSGTIADQESIFTDGQTFNIVPLPAKPDAAATIRDLRASDPGRGITIYRSGD